MSIKLRRRPIWQSPVHHQVVPDPTTTNHSHIPYFQSGISYNFPPTALSDIGCLLHSLCCLLTCHQDAMRRYFSVSTPPPQLHLLFIAAQVLHNNGITLAAYPAAFFPSACYSWVFLRFWTDLQLVEISLSRVCDGALTSLSAPIHPPLLRYIDSCTTQACLSVSSSPVPLFAVDQT